MKTMASIRHFTRVQLNKEKWDHCVQQSSNGYIYCQSFFLDIMAPDWEALVLGDYEAVMPLTHGKKIGCRYIYQPFLAAQTGIVGASMSSAITDAFLDHIPRSFKLADIQLNEHNIPDRYATQCSTRINMLLDLHASYGELKARYHRLAQRMLLRAEKAGLTIQTDRPLAENLAFYRHHYGFLFPKGEQSFQQALTLFMEAASRDQLLALTAMQGADLVGTYFLLYDERFVYSVLGGTAEKGKGTGAFYLLTDFAVQHFAGSGRIFRFEGSDEPGIARFNKSFHPQEVSYPQLRINRLPLLLRWLK